MLITIKKLVIKYIQFDSQQKQMPKLFLQVLQIQYCLINISYIKLDGALIDQFPQVRMMQVIGRPQLIIQIEGIEYVTFTLNFFYWLAFFTKFKGWEHFALLASLLDMSLLNFLIEQNMTILQMICTLSLIMITLIRTFLSRSKSDLSVKNTDYIENNIFLILIRLITLLQIGINYINEYAVQYITIVNCALFAMVIFKYRILGSYIITEIGFCIQIASLYYCFLIVFGTIDQFTSDIIFLPFVYKIGSNLIFKMDQDDIKSQKITQQILNYTRESRNSLYDYQMENNLQKVNSLNTKSLTAKQQTHLASTLIVQHPLKALKILFRVQQMHEKDLIFYSMINLLIQKSFKSLKQMLESKIKGQLQSHQFLDVMKKEQFQHDIQIEISYILRTKINLMITYNAEIRNQQYYSDSINAVNSIIQLRDKIANCYKLYPTQKHQAVYIFYLVEIINDIISASEVGGFLQASTDFKTNLKLQEGSNNYYMITEYKQDLIIKSVSKKLADYMKQSSLQLIGQNIKQLIPVGIREHHNNLVDNFLISGQSRFYQTTDTILIQQLDSGCLSFEFSFDIYFSNTSIQFIALFQQTFEQPYYLILDSKGIISAESESLQQYLCAGKICKSLIGLNIKDLILNIDQLRYNENKLEEAIIAIENVKIQTQLQIQDRVIANIVRYSTIRFIYMKRVSNQATIEEQKIDLEQVFQLNSELNENALIEIPRETNYIQESDINPFKTIEHVNQMESNRISQEEMVLVGQRKKDIYYDVSRSLQNDSHQSQSIERQMESQSLKHNNIDDRSSMMSSYQTMKTSVFYRNYQIIQKINQLSGQSKFHNLHFGFLILVIVFSLVLGFVQLISIKTSLSSLVSDIDLLQIKNIATQPIETFLITRYTIRNYNNLLANGAINDSQYAKLVAYPRSNLAEGFSLLYNNLQTVMDRQELQEDLLKIHQYSIYTKTLGRNVSTINMTLRNFIDTLLQYQQKAMISYLLDGSTISDSPYSMFQYKNQPLTKSTFQDINSQIYSKTLQTASQVELFCDIIIIVILNLSCILLIISIYYRQLIITNCDKYYQIYSQSYEHDIKYELKRLKQLLEYMSKDENYIFSYLFKIEQLEKSIEHKEHNTEIKRNNNFNRTFSKFTLLPFYLISSAVIADVMTTYFQSKYFLSRYPNTVELYWHMSDIGTDIPTMYAEREILYFRSIYPYLNTTDLDQIYIEVMSALRRTQQFLAKEYSSNLVSSSSFINTLNVYNQQSICPYIPTNNGFNNTLQLCQQVLGGNIQNGLKPLLTYLTNQIQTDQELNNFTVKTYNSFQELEGIYMTSIFIGVINDEFRSDLLVQTNNLINQIQAYNIVYFVILILLLLIGIKFYTKSLINHYHNCQRLVCLVPRSTIFLDDLFDRNINMRIIHDLLN